MSWDFRFSKEALLDIQSAAEWYDRQSVAQGNRFRDEVKAALARLQAQPDLYACVADRVRRVRVRKFPYSIYYSLEHSIVKVGAIVRDGRDLQSILARMKSP